MAQPDTEIQEIELDGQAIRYTLKRSRRRSLGLRVDGQGLTVNMPLRASKKWVNEVLRDKAAWVLKKLRQAEAQKALPVSWQDGEKLPFLGDEISLSLMSGAARTQPVLYGENLVVTCVDPLNQSAIQTKVEQWYKRQALICFTGRLDLYTKRLELAAAPPLRLSNATSLWGSCNAQGILRLSWRLIKAPLYQIDYVVAHELAHLRHMNHSPAFWAVVESIYPGCAQARADLSAQGVRYQTF